MVPIWVATLTAACWSQAQPNSDAIGVQTGPECQRLGSSRNSRKRVAATRLENSRPCSPIRWDLRVNLRSNDLRFRGGCTGAPDWRIARNSGSPLRRAGWTTTVRRDTVGKQFAPIWSRFSFNRSVTVHQQSSAAENRAKYPCARDIEDTRGAWARATSTASARCWAPFLRSDWRASCAGSPSPASDTIPPCDVVFQALELEFSDDVARGDRAAHVSQRDTRHGRAPNEMGAAKLGRLDLYRAGRTDSAADSERFDQLAGGRDCRACRRGPAQS